jgi:signal transduction histidine kinase
MKISTFIFVSFLVILALFSITTYINFRLSRQVTDNAEYLARSTELVRSSSQFQRNTINMVSGFRGFLLTGDKYFIQTYDSAASDNERILKELTTLLVDTSQLALLKEIIRLNEKWIDEYTEPLREAKLRADFSDDNFLLYNKLYREKSSGEAAIQAQLLSRFREFSNREYQQRNERSLMLASSAQEARSVSLTLTIISLLIAIVIVFILVNRISNRIGKMVNMADEISSGNYNVNLKDLGNDELTALATSLNHMATELAGNISQLKTKNEELDQFAHSVSHDLKGPLRGIDNVITWIEEDHEAELSSKLKEYLALIKGRVIRAENLIQGILSYARIGKEKMPREEVDVNELMEEIKEAMPMNQGIKIICERLPVLYTERIPLFQVLLNLVNNAVKYHDKPGGTVKIYYREHADHYEFFVQDNGPGISETYHKKIFVIFQTLLERDSFESTGVGLAIVKKILDVRKQSIRIESTPGHGSTFSFTWPKSSANA